MQMPGLVDADERHLPLSREGSENASGMSLTIIRSHVFSKTTLISERIAMREKRGEKERRTRVATRHRGINNKLLQNHSRSSWELPSLKFVLTDVTESVAARACCTSN